MKARWFAAVVLAVLVACASPDMARHATGLRPTGEEAPVAATVPNGAETLPTWQRTAEGTATLVVPADLLFATDSWALSPAAAAVLQQVVSEYRPGKHVLVEGHADSDGPASYNQALSERRAAAVAAWLIGNGVPDAAVDAQGWGEDRPAVDEVDAAAKAQNRRVVVTVTGPASAPTPVRTAHPRRLQPLRMGPRAQDPPTTSLKATRRIS